MKILNLSRLISITETELIFRASPDRKIVFWVHANGMWSEAAWGNILTK